MATREEFYSLPEETQAEWIAVWEEERSTCRQCGQKRDDCSNPEHEWYPQRSVDYAVAVQAVAQRRWQRLHEKAQWHDGRFRVWAEDYSPITPFHRDDGVTIWVSREDLSPDDDFLNERSVAEQSPGEQD